jgi:hypothetical protein
MDPSLAQVKEAGFASLIRVPTYLPKGLALSGGTIIQAGI